MKFFERHALISRFLVFVVFPLALFAGWGVSYLQKSVPRKEGEYLVGSIRDNVEIAREQHGVPVIRAQNDQDAYFGMGFVHAQDRLWQLEMQKRIAQGRLSEVLGKSALSQDIWMRTLALYKSAESAWEGLSPEAKSSLEAYAKGVNAYIEQIETLPPEFLLLDVEPEPWSPVDSLAWLKVFALNQSNGMRLEANRYIARKYLNEAQWSRLEKQYPENGPVTVDVVASMQKLVDISVSLQRELKIGGTNVGSNAWVVSGELSESGSALLANDPHMSLQIPSMWYVASIRSPSLHASGMSIVGLPNIVFGENNHIAWGGTNMMADTQDLYVLQVDPQRPDHYLVDGEWKRFETWEEKFTVRSDFPDTLRAPLDPVSIQIRHSHFGPVVNDFAEAVERPVSLRWTALDPGDTSYETIYRLSYARNWKEFNEAVEPLIAPAINLLYIDKQNNIGYLGGGRIPVRQAHKGMLPVSTEDSNHEWSGYIPFDSMPRDYNPERGYIVSANNRIAGEDYPYFISADWAPPARAQRIEESIAQTLKRKKKISLEDMQKLQADVMDLEAVELKDYLITLLESEENVTGLKEVLHSLAVWDGRMEKDKTNPSIFHFWLRNLKSNVLGDDLNRFKNNKLHTSILQSYIDSVTPVQLKQIMTDEGFDWCDNQQTPAAETCQAVALESLEKAIFELEKLKGSESNWEWGGVNNTVYQHLPFSNVNLLDLVFERRLPGPGSENSVNAASSDYSFSKGFEQNFGAAFRQIVSLGSGGKKHLYMNSTGQSGNPLSEHFDDMVVPFNQSELYELTDTDSNYSALYLRPVSTLN